MGRGTTLENKALSPTRTLFDLTLGKESSLRLTGQFHSPAFTSHLGSRPGDGEIVDQ